MLGHRRQDSLEQRVETEAELAETLAGLCTALATARDAVGSRAAAVEERVVGAQAGDELALELRDCSRVEAELHGELRLVGERVTEAEVRVASFRDRREEAVAEWERINAKLDLDPAPDPAPLSGEERAAVEASIERLIRRREQLGPVNPLAEGEYDAAKQHVAELESQREDLEQALDELGKLIRQTDREITAAFEETFKAAGENFGELIEHMFPGGSGRLRMVEAPKPERVLGGADPASMDGTGSPDAEADAAAEEEDGESEEERDPAETAGVEIEVTPAGKATRRLSLLSGGEKSLVALAFVFSVFLARPSPFYILDEVEAALDDANIDRFLQLVRRFSDRAQFVIVTHQKRTMDAADVLYGVSMKDGATKVISRRLPREPKLAEAEPDARAA
jgi:chromosome segregation protein